MMHRKVTSSFILVGLLYPLLWDVSGNNNKCIGGEYVPSCADSNFDIIPEGNSDELAIEALSQGGPQPGGMTRVAASHIWAQRENLCAGFDSIMRVGSLFDCVSEALSTFEAPECRIADELEWGLHFRDQIQVSTGNVTDTNFYLGTCPSEGGQETRFLGITLEDLRILEIAPSPVLTFPEISADNPRIIHMPVVVYTNSKPQFFSPTLLDQTVQVRVVPAAFTFDWGDGEVLGPVASPGVPDVDSGYQHSYSSLEPVRISVTTQWSASWSLDGQTWIRVPGFLSTTNTTPELPIVEKVPMLVPSS